MSELKVHARPCDIEPMVQIEEIRAAFASRLKKSVAAKGIDQWGAGARLSEIAKVTPKAASKWLNGEAIPGPAKMQAIAEALDVKIEWLQHGAGDEPGHSSLRVTKDSASAGTLSAADLVRDMLEKHGKGLPKEVRQRIASAANEPASNVITVDFSRPGQVGDEVWIAHYDVRGAMGDGQVPHDYPETFQDVRVSPSHLRELGVQFKEHFHLKMISGQGESMAPTIKSRDPLLIDVTVREFTGDGIYALTWQNHFYIKRLQVLDEDNFEMLSDNPLHGPRTIRKDDTYIQGRILFVWNGQPV